MMTITPIVMTMDFNYTTLIYILIGIVYYAFRAIGKGAKEDGKPKKAPKKNLLEELEDMIREKQEPAPKPAPAPVQQSSPPPQRDRQKSAKSTHSDSTHLKETYSSRIRMMDQVTAEGSSIMHPVPPSAHMHDPKKARLKSCA